MADTKKNESKAQDKDESKIEALEETVVRQQELLEKYEAQLAKFSEQSSMTVGAKKKQSKPKPPTKTFQVGGKSYRFRVVQFRINGEVVKAVEALDDKELLKNLVETRSTLVEPAK